MTYRINNSNYQLNKIRMMHEGLHYSIDQNNPPIGRGIALQQLLSSGFILDYINLNNIKIQDLTCDDDCQKLSFKSVSLINSEISNSVFDDVNFSGSDLEGASFIKSSLSSINMKDSNLCSVKFIDTELEKVLFNSKEYYIRKCGKGNAPCSNKKHKILSNCKILVEKKKFF